MIPTAGQRRGSVPPGRFSKSYEEIVSYSLYFQGLFPFGLGFDSGKNSDILPEPLKKITPLLLMPASARALEAS